MSGTWHFRISSVTVHGLRFVVVVDDLCGVVSPFISQAYCTRGECRHFARQLNCRVTGRSRLLIFDSEHESEDQ